MMSKNPMKDSDERQNWVCTKAICGGYNRAEDYNCSLCGLPRVASSSDLALQLHYMFVHYESGELGDDTADAITQTLALFQAHYQQQAEGDAPSVMELMIQIRKYWTTATGEPEIKEFAEYVQGIIKQALTERQHPND